MDLQSIAKEIKETIEKKKTEYRLSFVESKHIYYMIRPDGQITSKWPSVSKVIKNFFEPFDAQGISLRMAKGDVVKQKELLAEWRAAGDYSTNLGGRVHYELEKYIVSQYGDYKKVRQPIFECNEEQITKSDKMIEAGKKFIDLMHERGAVLLDTEMVLGSPELGYVGQPDDVWIMLNRDKTDFGLVVSDHKSGQEKNFQVFPYTTQLYPPFEKYPNNALGHYYLQLPLYGKLVTKMLEGSRFEKTKFLGGVVALMKDNGTFTEYKVPQDVVTTIMNMDLKPFIK